MVVLSPLMDHSAYVILSSQLVPSDWVDLSLRMIKLLAVVGSLLTNDKTARVPWIILAS